MFPRNTSGFASFPPVDLIVSFSLSMELLLIRRIGDSFDKSIGAILPSFSWMKLDALRRGLKCRFSDTAGNRARVQGTPTAEVKKSVMCGEVYVRAAISSPQTRDRLDFKVQLADGAKERGTLSGAAEELCRETSRYPDMRSTRGRMRAILLYLKWVGKTVPVK